MKRQAIVLQKWRQCRSKFKVPTRLDHMHRKWNRSFDRLAFKITTLDYPFGIQLLPLYKIRDLINPGWCSSTFTCTFMTSSTSGHNRGSHDLPPAVVPARLDHHFDSYAFSFVQIRSVEHHTATLNLSPCRSTAPVEEELLPRGRVQLPLVLLFLLVLVSYSNSWFFQSSRFMRCFPQSGAFKVLELESNTL